MIWNNFSEFVHMGGYGLYVWGSYGVTLLLMTLEPWAAARRRRGPVAGKRSQCRGQGGRWARARADARGHWSWAECAPARAPPSRAAG